MHKLDLSKKILLISSSQSKTGTRLTSRLKEGSEKIAEATKIIESAVLVENYQEVPPGSSLLTLKKATPM